MTLVASRPLAASGLIARPRRAPAREAHRWSSTLWWLLATFALGALTGCPLSLFPGNAPPKDACPESQIICFGATVCSMDPQRGCTLCVCDKLPHGPVHNRK